jgi:hypothetical protein
VRSAVVAALVAALVGSGGAAVASSWLDGRQIRPHTIPLNRLTRMPASTLSNVSRVSGEEYVVQPGTTGFALADCPKGELAISGGFAVIAELNPLQVVGLVSEPKVDLSGWVSGFEDHGTTPATVQAFAVCAPGNAK